MFVSASFFQNVFVWFGFLMNFNFNGDFGVFMVAFNLLLGESGGL